MNAMELQAAAEAIWDAQQRGIHYPPEFKGKFDVDTGYRVQLAVLQRCQKAGERHVGWKVGLTAKAIQEQVQYHEPVFGFLLQSGALRSGARVTFDELIMPSFENELCVTLGRTLKGPDVTVEQARAAIASVAPGLELVEKRGEFAADPPLSLADNVQQRYFVTGPAKPLDPALPLRDAAVRVFINGEEVDRATGVEVLGDPAASVAWLVNRLAAFGWRLDKGMQVMTGSFTKQYPIAQGDLIEATFDPFGSVSVEFI